MRAFKPLTQLSCSVALSAIALSSAHASVGEILSPSVDKDELEVQYNGLRTGDGGKGKNNAQTHGFQVEYGLTDRLAIEGGVAYKRSSGESLDFDSAVAEAKYELTSQEEGYWLGFGVLGEYVYKDDSRSDKIEAKLLASHETEQFFTRGNLILDREIGSDRKKGVRLRSRMSTEYDLNEYFNPAIEWHAEWGTLNHIEDSDNQQHFVGPAAYGELFEWDGANGQEHEIEYEISYTFGLTDASADTALRLKLEYETEF